MTCSESSRGSEAFSDNLSGLRHSEAFGFVLSSSDRALKVLRHFLTFRSVRRNSKVSSWVLSCC